jgi:hypothetical protein
MTNLRNYCMFLSSLFACFVLRLDSSRTLQDLLVPLSIVCSFNLDCSQITLPHFLRPTFTVQSCRYLKRCKLVKFKNKVTWMWSRYTRSRFLNLVLDKCLSRRNSLGSSFNSLLSDSVESLADLVLLMLQSKLHWYMYVLTFLMNSLWSFTELDEPRLTQTCRVWTLL